MCGIKYRESSHTMEHGVRTKTIQLYINSKLRCCEQNSVAVEALTKRVILDWTRDGKQQEHSLEWKKKVSVLCKGLKMTKADPEEDCGQNSLDKVMFAEADLKKWVRGGTEQSFVRGGSAPRSNPLPFHTPFWQKRYPFYIPFIEKRYPFHSPILGSLVLVFMKCLINELLQPSGASIRKIIIKGPFKYLNDRFPYPLYTSTCEIPTLFYT